MVLIRFILCVSTIRYLSQCRHEPTDGGVIAEKDGQEDKLPDKDDHGGDDPDQEEGFDLLEGAQNQQYIRKTIPVIYCYMSVCIMFVLTIAYFSM